MLQSLYFCQPFRRRLLEYAARPSAKDADENLLTCLAELFVQVRTQSVQLCMQIVLSFAHQVLYLHVCHTKLKYHQCVLQSLGWLTRLREQCMLAHAHTFLQCMCAPGKSVMVEEGCCPMPC